MTITSAHERLKSRQISVPELISGYLDRVVQIEPKIHAFLRVERESAMLQAEGAQKRFDEDKDVSVLTGIPVGYKDVFLTRGVETTAASNILRGYIPPYSATVVDRIEAAGAISLGKLNCDAFAHGSSTENSDFGPTKNPYNTEYVPGGSSGGSAAAVASSEVLFATGTDAGGSIRHPAGFTNTVGLKPTYGRVSRYGIIAMASSTDSPGPMTKTVQDCAHVLGVIAGHDPSDATSSEHPVPDYQAVLGKSIKGWRLGVPKEFFSTGLDPRVREATQQALHKLEELGGEIVEVSLPNIKYSLAVYYIVMTSEVSSNLSRYDGIKYGYSVERQPELAVRTLQGVYDESRRRGFGAEAKRRIMLGTFALSAGYYDAYYKKGLQARQILRRDFQSAFERCDLLVTPVSPTPPFRLGEKTDDPLAMYLSDIYTTSVNLTGNPAISVPCGFVESLPIGLQLIAPHFMEERLLQAGYAYEQATRFFEKTPSL